MVYVVEILLIAIVVVFAIIGIKCGFIKLAAKPVKFALAVILAFSLCSSVADKVVTPIIDEPVTGYVSGFLVDNCQDLTGENLEQELPTLIKLAALMANVDIKSDLQISGEAVIEAITEKIMDPVIGLISSIIAFFAVYFLSKILLWIVFGLINSLFQNGVFGILNRVLGFLLSGFFGIIVAWAVAVITELVIHVPALQSIPAVASFDGGYIYDFFNTYNPMELLLSF